MATITDDRSTRRRAADAFRTSCLDTGEAHLAALSMEIYWESVAPRTRPASDAARDLFAEWKAEHGW